MNARERERGFAVDARERERARGRDAVRERRGAGGCEGKGMKTDEEARFRNVAVAPVVWRKPRRANRRRCSG